MRSLHPGSLGLLLCVLGLAGPAWAAAPAPARELSLDGTWEVEEGMRPDQTPKVYRHQVPVPGLVHSAAPAFAQVDEFQTKQVLSSLVYYDKYPKADYDKLGDIRGLTHQPRNYFWYRKNFDAPAARAVAILKVSKAQFGTVVYMNGVRIGAHDSCFTAGYFDVSRAIRWNRPNAVVIRVGAHPNVLPATVTCGTDFEKLRWTPGIYDSVALISADNPVIAAVQVAPQLKGPAVPQPAALVQTELHNYGKTAVETELRQHVVEWKSGRPASDPSVVTVRLVPGETKLVKQLLPVPAAHLWSPEDPFLYQVDTQTSGDATHSRFGMREFHFDTVTQKAYLNGRPYFLRGSNIGLHRFFEDSKSGVLPWTESWVQRLLVDIPKQMHWNAFRFTIGPVPQRWLDIADESGLLIQYEYSVWVGSPIYTVWKSSYDVKQMTSEYTEWMRDSWNHPSIVLWDATNESMLPEITAKVLPAVRGLDLSNRPWENSYGAPAGPDDPVEDHTYFLESVGGKFDASQGGKPFDLSDLEWMDGAVSNPFTRSAHAKILNEYGWIWLNRDGSPTLLTEHLFPKLLGDRDTVESRRAFSARELGAETEMWRAYRRYAAIMHFVYLTASDANGFTSDNFVDVEKLILEPHFETAMREAFKPLGVYLNFWHSAIGAGQARPFEIFMVNDEDRPRAGTLRLSYGGPGGQESGAAQIRFALPPLGAQSYQVDLQAPPAVGAYTLQAVATPDDEAANPTVSRRDVTVQKDPPP